MQWHDGIYFIHVQVKEKGCFIGQKIFSIYDLHTPKIIL